jgi:perosamine synthetase
MCFLGENVMSDRAFFFYRGRVALYALLKAMGVGKGDEVLLQAFTCLAVPTPIVSIGATPIYVDINPETLSVEPCEIENKITNKTKAIIVQHTFGVPAKMDAILAIAKRHNLYVIEDCCHALYSRYDGQEVGSFGHAAFYSFEWGKPIVIGVGGCAVVNDAELADKVRGDYSHFVSPSFKEWTIINAEYFAHRYILTPSLFWFVRDAYRFMSDQGLIVGSFRLEEFEGRVSPDYGKRMFDGLKERLFRKLKTIDHRTSHMRHVASEYAQMLSELGHKPVGLSGRYDPVYLRYPLLLNNKEKILEEARKHRVEVSGMFVSPVHPLQKEEFKLVGYQPGTCPVAETASDCVISFPTHSKIGERELSKTRSLLVQLVRDGLLQVPEPVLPAA